jgi:hypothetical protein
MDGGAAGGFGEDGEVVGKRVTSVETEQTSIRDEALVAPFIRRQIADKWCSRRIFCNRSSPCCIAGECRRYDLLANNGDPLTAILLRKLGFMLHNPESILIDLACDSFIVESVNRLFI